MGFPKQVKDLTGKKFYRLEVLSYAGRPVGRRGAQWLCRCDCGAEVIIRGDTLQTESQSCGGPLCLHAAKNEYPIPGEKFGMLEAVGHARSSTSGHYWTFKCDCGNTAEMRLNRVKSGERDHCGCRSLEKMVIAHMKDEHKDRDQLPLLALFNSYKSRASMKGEEFTINLKQFSYLTKQKCFYCDLDPLSSKKARSRIFLDPGKDYVYNGIDRWDSYRGYSVDNCVPCCKYCNWSKRKLSGERFIEWICNLRKHADNLIANNTQMRAEVLHKLFELAD